MGRTSHKASAGVQRTLQWTCLPSHSCLWVWGVVASRYKMLKQAVCTLLYYSRTIHFINVMKVCELLCCDILCAQCLVSWICVSSYILLSVGQDCYTRLWSLKDGHLLRTIPSPYPAANDLIPNVIFSSKLGGHGGLPGLLMAVKHDLYYFPYNTDYQ